MDMAHCQSSVIIVNESFAILCDGSPWLIESVAKACSVSTVRFEFFMRRRENEKAMRVSEVVGGRECKREMNEHRFLQFHFNLLMFN